jgi:hypothetical protein
MRVWQDANVSSARNEFPLCDQAAVRAGPPNEYVILYKIYAPVYLDYGILHLP